MNFVKNNCLLNGSLLKWMVVFLTAFFSSGAYAQVSDDFSDGDFTADPVWTGTAADFIVNTSQQLQLNAPAAGTSYLVTAHNLSGFDNKEWSVWVRQNFAGSGSNFGRIYLTSESSDLTTEPDGIYLQLGEALSVDAVRLMQRNGGAVTQICASADGTIASAFQAGIKVVRDNTGMWSLYIDFAGGTDYALVATGSETAVPVGTHIGYLCTYTAGNATRFYLDDVYAGDEIVDTDPPVMTSVQVIDANNIDVLFSETITTVSAETTGNYELLPANSIADASLDGTNPALVHLQLIQPLSNGNTYTLTSSDIEDLNGNTSVSQSLNFTYLIAEIPAPGDVIINEFMADPSPVVGLPEVEFVEIYNVSNKIFNTTGWKLGDNSTFGTILSGWLLPGEFIVLCPAASVAEFPNAVGVTSFPSLNNSTDDIVITDNNGVQLDKITYTLDWYQDAAKKDGGWTIERINPVAPCSGASNWKASVDPGGGTPGTQNSVYDITPDTTVPVISSATVTAANRVEVLFSKPVDSLSLSQASVTINPVLTEISRIINGSDPVSFVLEFAETINSSQHYTMTISGVEDCWGNTGISTAVFVLPGVADSGDVIINEILFNQLTGGSDWIELYNKSDKLIDLKGWKIARIVNGAVTDHKLIASNYFLQPKDYVVIGADSGFVISNYPASVPGKFYQVAVPTMSNDTGSVVVIYPLMGIDTVEHEMDRLMYSGKWHFRLIDDKKGKSLERMDPEQPTQNEKNWHTAAEAVGFATPGGENSQYYPALHNGTVNLTSDVISPDNDGFEDVLQINYEMSAAGMLATVRIFDDRGRVIKTITKNELLGITGTITWDGIREDGQKATIGTYVMLMEAFDINGGNEFVVKKAFVVAGKM